MARIRITKVFHFEAAHALHGYPGKCAQIHGHSYELQVTVIGTPIADPDHPFTGMVMDFSELKRIVKERVIDRYDHALLLSRRSVPDLFPRRELFARIEVMDRQPTCEHMIEDVAASLEGALPEGVQLHALRLVETPTSFAEWCVEEN